VQMTDDVRYFQRIDVGSLELPNDIVFHGSNGFPVSMLCSDESLLEACLSTGIFASEQVQLQLSGSDGSLVSFDPLAGNFEQRSDSVFVDVPALTTDGRLCVKVNPLFLEEDSTYDLVFILNGQG